MSLRSTSASILVLGTSFAAEYVMCQQHSPMLTPDKLWSRKFNFLFWVWTCYSAINLRKSLVFFMKLRLKLPTLGDPTSQMDDFFSFLFIERYHWDIQNIILLFHVFDEREVKVLLIHYYIKLLTCFHYNKLLNYYLKIHNRKEQQYRTHRLASLRVEYQISLCNYTKGFILQLIFHLRTAEVEVTSLRKFTKGNKMLWKSLTALTWVVLGCVYLCSEPAHSSSAGYGR